MKLILTIAATAAGVLLNCGVAQARQPAAPDAAPAANPASSNMASRARNAVKNYDEGRLGARTTAVEALRAARWGTQPKMETVAGLATELSRTYARRSGRMQTNLDVSSGAVTLGGSGYLLSAGAGAATQAFWGYGALLPVLVAQFNAHEPTRDLFFGAALGVERISGRYAALTSARSMATALRAQSNRLIQGAAPTIGLETRCAGLRAQIAAVRAWPAEGLDRAVILPDLLAIESACQAAVAANGDLQHHHDMVGQWMGLLPQSFAADLLALDANLEQRDYQLRYSPTKTLSGIAAAPFQAASKLLTGEDGKAALDGLKTQDAFQSLDVSLSTIPLPPAPVLTFPKASLSPGSAAREGTAVQRKPKTTPSAEQVTEALMIARGTLAALQAVERQLALESQMATTAVLAARSDRLTFRYDATTRAVSVTLAPTAAPSPVPPAV